MPVYLTGVLLFAQFGLLQIWRVIPGLQNAHAGIVLFVMIVGIGFWSQALIRSVSNGKPKQKKNLPKEDWLYLGGSVLFGFLLWLIWIHPTLSRSMDVWGDEDHHFNVSYSFAEYFKTYFHFSLPQDIAPHALRYPNLTNLWCFWFLNPLSGPINTPFWQRFPLLFPYLATVATTFLFALNFLKNRKQSLLYTLAYASCPILLCYTGDKYLDIFHPLFFGLSSYFIYRLIVDQTSHFALNAALSTGLLSLVRDNSAPTTLFYGGILFLFFSPVFGVGPNKLRSWKNALLYSLTAILPFVCFYSLKLITTSIDQGRLAFAHIFVQNYSDFFKYLFLYFPPIFLLVLFAFRARNTLSRQKTKLLGLSAICISLVGQLLIYSLFEAGWMPWTRNYLMFIGQLSVLVLIVLTEILHSQNKKYKIAAVTILLSSLSFNLIFGSLGLASNRYFHENELHYDYQTLFSSLKTKPILPPGSTVYMNKTIVVAPSLEYSANQIGYHFQYKALPEESGFLAFDSFVSRLPADSQYILFHYRRPQTIMPILSKIYPVVDRPTALQLTHFEVLIDLPDPGSNGKIGLLLLRRYN